MRKAYASFSRLPHDGSSCRDRRCHLVWAPAGCEAAAVKLTTAAETRELGAASLRSVACLTT